MTGVHLHLLLSHVPVIGILIGVVLLAWGTLRRSDDLSKASLILFIVLTLLSIVTLLTGESAEDTAERLAGVDKASIERHEDAAKLAAISMYVLGAASLAVLVIVQWFRRAARGALVAVLLLSIVSAGMMVWTANLGGKVRHTEILSGQSVSQASHPNH
ncbi:MAG: hypothetical protein IT447_16460 [Phycisphaerales bacterium]|jgi:uncharacterized membrane protein|nr:hypothetical protein [Phycisphaerales bacterium]